MWGNLFSVSENDLDTKNTFPHSKEVSHLHQGARGILAIHPIAAGQIRPELCEQEVNRKEGRGK